MRIAVIGIGLIGGSVALAARERLGATVSGYDHSAQARQAGLARGALDRASETLAGAVADAEAVFVAVPVRQLERLVGAALAAAPQDCVVTDVGSTKRAVVAAHADRRFVGGHPLAGAENAGVEHARADLFEGSTWYLTPGADTSGVLYERLHRLLHGLGAQPAAIDPHTHDRILATVSHLPHVLANVLVAQAAGALAAGDERLPATGPSFRDATRVAGAPSAIWTDIYLSNRDALTAEIDETLRRLTAIRDSLVAGDADAVGRLERLRGRRSPAAAGGPAGGRPAVRAASVGAQPARGDRPARPRARPRRGQHHRHGPVSRRDMSEGVVALWIAGEPAAARAQTLLAGLGFPVASA